MKEDALALLQEATNGGQVASLDMAEVMASTINTVLGDDPNSIGSSSIDTSFDITTVRK